MALNKKIITEKAAEKTAEKLAEKLADKPYGKPKSNDTITRTTITLPKSLLMELEDEALANKRKGIGPKSVSAIIRQALSNSSK